MGELEAAVMEVLWDSGGWLTPGDVHEVLSRRRVLGYTTVTTVLMRLADKGRLERRRHGRPFAYHPTATRAQWSALRMRSALLGGGDRAAALGHFVENLGEAERAQLRRMLAERGKR